MNPQTHRTTPLSDEGQSPFFSVIVPVYNVAPYLGECLDSVLAQTFTDWECLCTDDGSKDGSDLILNAYARRDPRFRIVHQPNAGVSVARNRALGRLRGQWVGFVDSDDFVHPGWLACVRETSDAYPASGMIRFGYRRVAGQARYAEAVWENLGRVRDGEVLEGWGRVAILWGMCGFFVQFAIRRDLVCGVWFDRALRVGEDCVWLVETAFAVQSAVSSDFTFYCYRTREGSALVQGRRVTDALTFLPRLSQCFERRKAEIVRNGLLRQAQRHLTEAVELEYLGWFVQTETSRGIAARAHRALLWRLWRGGFFRVRCVSRAWRVPMVLLMLGALGACFRGWAKVVRGVVAVKHRVLPRSGNA